MGVSQVIDCLVHFGVPRLSFLMWVGRFSSIIDGFSVLLLASLSFLIWGCGIPSFVVLVMYNIFL